MRFIDPATLKEHGSARDQVRCAFAARQRMKMPAVYLVGRGDRRMASVDVTDARNDFARIRIIENETIGDGVPGTDN